MKDGSITANKLLEALKKPITIRGMSVAAGVSTGTVRKHLEKFLENGKAKKLTGPEGKVLTEKTESTSGRPGELYGLVE